MQKKSGSAKTHGAHHELSLTLKVINLTIGTH